MGTRFCPFCEVFNFCEKKLANAFKSCIIYGVES